MPTPTEQEPIQLRGKYEQVVSSLDAVSKEMHDLCATHEWSEEKQSQFEAKRKEYENLEAQAKAIKTTIGQRTQDALEEVAEKGDGTNAEAKEARDALKTWALLGDAGLSREAREALFPQAAQTAGGSNLGGTTIDTHIADRLIPALKAFGGVRRVAYIEQTSDGGQLTYPTLDAASEEGELVANETTGAGDQVSSTTIGAYRFSSKVSRLSRTLLQDSQFDIEAWMRCQMMRRLARIQNRRFTLGTGTNQPKGVVTAAKTGVTSTTATGIAWEDLVNLEHSVDPAYRMESMDPADSGMSAKGMGMTAFMLSDSALRAVKLERDVERRPIWLPPMLQDGKLGSILGYPYVVNQHMAAVATGAISVLFGNFRYYLIREVRELEIQRLVERYAEYDQVGLIGVARCDGQPIGKLTAGKTDAWAKLTQA